MKTTVQPDLSEGVNLMDPSLSAVLEDPQLYDELNTIFPDDVLFTANGQSSVGVDTKDLIQCVSVSVDTSDLLEKPTISESRQSPPILSPPITPIDKGEAKEKFHAIDLSSTMHNSGNDSSKHDDNDHQSGNVNRDRESPQTKKDGYAPHKGKRIRSPEADNNRQVWVRRDSYGDESSNHEGRQLRPNPMPPSRYKGNTWVRHLSPNHSDGKDSQQETMGDEDEEMDTKLTKDVKAANKNEKRPSKRAADRSPMPDDDDDSDFSQSGHQSGAIKRKSNAVKGSRKKVKEDRKGNIEKATDQQSLKEVKEERQRKVRKKVRKTVIVEKVHVCSICEQICVSASGLRTHCQFQHMGIRYRCNICQYVHGLMPNMGQHFRKKHPEKLSEMKVSVTRFTDETEDQPPG